MYLHVFTTAAFSELKELVVRCLTSVRWGRVSVARSLAVLRLGDNQIAGPLLLSPKLKHLDLRSNELQWAPSELGRYIAHIKEEKIPISELHLRDNPMLECFAEYQVLLAVTESARACSNCDLLFQ